MLRTQLFQSVVCLGIVLTCPVALALPPGFSGKLQGRPMGSQKRITASFKYKPDSRTLLVRMPETSHTSQTRSWELPSRSLNHPFKVKTRTSGAPEVLKTELFPGGMIYHYLDKSGQLTNSSRKPTGTAVHRLQLPANQPINQALIESLVKKLAEVSPSGNVWTYSK